MYIYMQETTLSNLSGTWYGGTQVWSGSRTFNTTGWHSFTLSPSFRWDNNNLLISFQHGYTGWTSNYPYFRTVSTSFTSQNYGYSDSGLPTPSYTTTARALIRLTFSGSRSGGGDRYVYIMGDSTWSEPIYKNGTARLESGRANVSFDDVFVSKLNGNAPTVVVTPMGPSNQLYVAEVDATGFSVVENHGTSDVRFNWIAIAKHKGYENPQLPAEVIAYDYNEKISRGLHNDSDIRTDGEGLYFENGDLIVGVHPSLIPDPNFIALKEEFTENPGKRSFREWQSMFGSYGKEIGISEEEYNRQIASAQPEEAFFDEYGNQIPPEWVEEFKAEGVQMFSYEEAQERRKQAYIDNARAMKKAQDPEFQREKEEEHRREIEKHRKDDHRNNETGKTGNIAPDAKPEGEK